jgi:hypothetical protein
VGEDPLRKALLGIEGLLEAGERTEALSALAYVAGRRVELDVDALAAARRRAMLLLATGGDPHRALELDSRAVTALASDLDGPAERASLAEGFAELRGESEGLARVIAALELLAGDADLGWRAFACALLAEELGGEGDE